MATVMEGGSIDLQVMLWVLSHGCVEFVNVRCGKTRWRGEGLPTHRWPTHKVLAIFSYKLIMVLCCAPGYFRPPGQGVPTHRCNFFSFGGHSLASQWFAVWTAANRISFKQRKYVATATFKSIGHIIVHKVLCYGHKTALCRWFTIFFCQHNSKTIYYLLLQRKKYH